MGRKVRVIDIASRVGLSSTLVSLVLNNKADQHGIKRATQEKVLEAAVKMGYFDKPSETKDQKSDVGKSGLIAMVVPDINDPFSQEITPYLRQALGSIDVGLATLSMDPGDKKYDKFIASIKKLFSGLILTGESAKDSVVRSLKNSNYPFIILENSSRNIRMNLVKSDCEAGAKLLCDHIARLGYRRFTIVSSNKESYYEKENITCFIRILEEAFKDSVISELVLQKSVAVSYIYTEELGQYLRPPESTQLLVVADADLMIPVIKTLDHGKIRVPHDVAVISLEDGPGFDLLLNSITRIKRKLPEIATKTAKMIWTEVKNSGKSKFRRTVTIPPELIIGKSCGII